MNSALRTLRKRHDKANQVIHGMCQQSDEDEMQGRQVSCVWKYNMVAVMAREALALQKMLASRLR